MVEHLPSKYQALALAFGWHQQDGPAVQQLEVEMTVQEMTSPIVTVFWPRCRVVEFVPSMHEARSDAWHRE